MRDNQALKRIGIIAAGIAGASALHYLTSPSLILWHELFQRLYYLPIIYAAIFFGWRGGLITSLAAAICPRVTGIPTATVAELDQKYLQRMEDVLAV